MTARRLVVLEAAEHAALLEHLRAAVQREHHRSGATLTSFDLLGALRAVERAEGIPTRPEAA